MDRKWCFPVSEQNFRGFGGYFVNDDEKGGWF